MVKYMRITLYVFIVSSCISSYHNKYSQMNQELVYRNANDISDFIDVSGSDIQLHMNIIDQLNKYNIVTIDNNKSIRNVQGSYIYVDSFNVPLII
jgi:hypothetical protein